MKRAIEKIAAGRRNRDVAWDATKLLFNALTGHRRGKHVGADGRDKNISLASDAANLWGKGRLIRDNTENMKRILQEGSDKIVKQQGKATAAKKAYTDQQATFNKRLNRNKNVITLKKPEKELLKDLKTEADKAEAAVEAAQQQLKLDQDLDVTNIKFAPESGVKNDTLVRQMYRRLPLGGLYAGSDTVSDAVNTIASEAGVKAREAGSKVVEGFKDTKDKYDKKLIEINEARIREKGGEGLSDKELGIAGGVAGLGLSNLYGKLKGRPNLMRDVLWGAVSAVGTPLANTAYDDYKKTQKTASMSKEAKVASMCDITRKHIPTKKW